MGEIDRVQEVSPMEMIAALEADLKIARRTLKRIANADPNTLPGGPNNKHFGSKAVKSLMQVKVMAAEAYAEMTTKEDE